MNSNKNMDASTAKQPGSASCLDCDYCGLKRGALIRCDHPSWDEETEMRYVDPTFAEACEDFSNAASDGMQCPHCHSDLLWSEDRGAHCDGCDDFDPEVDLPASGQGEISIGGMRHRKLAEVRQTIEASTEVLASASHSQRLLALTKSEMDWNNQLFNAEIIGAPLANCRFLARIAEIRKHLDLLWHARAVVKSIHRNNRSKRSHG